MDFDFRRQKLAVCDIFIYDHNLVYTDQMVGGDLLHRPLLNIQLKLYVTTLKKSNFSIETTRYFTDKCSRLTFNPIPCTTPPQSHHRERERKKKKR